MRIALCTTTVHVPHALKLMRKCSDDVKFFVATDERTPGEARDFVHTVSNSQTNARITSSVWKCSEVIGWNTLARRNIAFLEALKWGADVIYSWDNDNLPVDAAHFWHFENSAFELFNGIKIAGTDCMYDTGHGSVSSNRWFDPGWLLIPPTRHRGYPYNIGARSLTESVIDAEIGVAAGLVIGDPDIDATTRMELRPDIGAVHLLGNTGVVVDPHTWTVFNSQNTAVIRELIPAWFMMPGVGRHDDIYASLIVQRVARERDLHVHFGPPFTYQQRNDHNLITDLRAEIDGMENVEKLADLLDHIQLPAKSVIEDTRIIYEQLMHCSFIPEESARAGLVWLEDCKTVF